MIVYPADWLHIGKIVSLKHISKTMEQIISGIKCSNLSFSGGLDSCLLLYWMLTTGHKVNTFTVACNEDHPDIHYAMKAIKYFESKFSVPINSDVHIFTTGIHGDEAVKSYYKQLALKIDSIISGDGIDELMCGYYSHQIKPDESTYYKYLRLLQKDHLVPLDQNSGSVNVYIPYLDKRLVDILVQIPSYEKVNRTDRKIIMKRLGKGKIPDYVIERKKYGFCTIS